MEKVDLKKELKHLYNPSAKQIVAVDVPDMNFLMINDQGAPSSPQYAAAIETLFNVAYTLKFMVKKTKGIDFAVMRLEGLWWVDDMSKFDVRHKDNWKWTAMIMQPEYVSGELYRFALDQVRKKKPSPALAKARFENFCEGCIRD